MKLLDEKGLKTVWSTCKTKFALSGHTHNYAGSGSPGGSANSAIGVVDYGQNSKTIQIGYSGTGISGDQIKYIAGYTDGSGNVNAKIKDVSKDALKKWLGIDSLDSNNIPTKLSQLINDIGFVTGSVSGNTITINGVSTTWANTWRGIQNNLTSSSTSDSLSANQGRILKDLVDGKANSSHTHNWSQISNAPNFGSINTVSKASECKKGYINIKEITQGSFSADGLTSGAVLFLAIYVDGTITYNGLIRVKTGYLSGSVKLSKGVNLLYVENNALTVISF